MAARVIAALGQGQRLASRLFGALSILAAAQRVRYQSPSARLQRAEMRRAGEELAAAVSDWRRFIETLSNVADKFKFGPSELGVISRVNQLLLDSVERLGGGSGKLVLLIFIAVWKTTYVVLRTAIQLLVAAIGALASLGGELSRLVTDYLHTQIRGFGTRQKRSTGFWGSQDAPPSIRKTVLYLLSGALLVGIPIAILTRFVLPAVMTVLAYMYQAVTTVSAAVPIVSKL